MTRQHFEALADALRRTKPEGGAEVGVWCQTVAEVAAVCARFNERFDQAKFMRRASGF